MTFEILKTLDIPLPPTNRDSTDGKFTGQTQEELLKSYYSKIEKANTQEKDAEDKEREINTYLLDVLGVDIKRM